VIARGFLPVVVGGTGLYIRSLLQGLDDLPGPESEIRDRLEREASEMGLDCLYRRLRCENPERAKKIHPADRKRIIRALEVGLSQRRTLKPVSAKLPSLTELGYEVTVVGIKKNRSELYRDIDERVEKMFESGLLDEVRRVAGAGFSRTAAQAVGYKEIIAYLRSGMTIERAKSMVKMNTRHLAKRQETWFRREKNIHWFEKTDSENNKIFSEKILRWFECL
jgi:tRNA dimethylallyltransferase